MQQEISLAEMTALLQKIKGAKIATIVTEGPAELLKRGNPFANVTKRTTMNVMMNFNYGNALKKALVKKDLATANRPVLPRVWGQRVPDSPFVMHKGHMYLEVKNNGRPSSVQYFVDGVQVDNQRIEPFVPKRKETHVAMCDIRIENIKELRINKVQYLVK